MDKVIHRNSKDFVFFKRDYVKRGDITKLCVRFYTFMYVCVHACLQLQLHLTCSLFKWIGVAAAHHHRHHQHSKTEWVHRTRITLNEWKRLMSYELRRLKGDCEAIDMEIFLVNIFSRFCVRICLSSALLHC